MSASDDNEILAVHLSRKELRELIEILQRAEDLGEQQRRHTQDYRMHRLRLERLKKSSIPPLPEKRESTRYITIEDLGAKKKGP